MNEVMKVRQEHLEGGSIEKCCLIFGKEFELPAVSNEYRIILHDDYPLIGKQDVDDFLVYSKKKKSLVISGCEARIHPFRLMYITENGYDRFVIDVPQKIRGNRHLYPEIYQFVPALIAIPPKLNLNSALEFKNLDMFVMCEEKLLDKTILTERLLISALNN
jgi:hypothetical protein